MRVFASEDFLQVIEEFFIVDHIGCGINVPHSQESDIQLIEVFNKHFVQNEVFELFNGHHFPPLLVVVLKFPSHVHPVL